MYFPTQSMNLSILTDDNVDEIGHFRKSTCFYMRKISLLRKWLVMYFVVKKMACNVYQRIGTQMANF